MSRSAAKLFDTTAQGEVSWVVMADPEGNEFDVLRPLTAEELASS